MNKLHKVINKVFKLENRYDSIKQQMNLNTKYYEGFDKGFGEGYNGGFDKGRDEEYEKQRRQIEDLVKDNFTMKYKGNTLFLDNLSIVDYIYIDKLMFDDASLEDIKTYVNSLN